jgi:hypothetical protein
MLMNVRGTVRRLVVVGALGAATLAVTAVPAEAARNTQGCRAAMKTFTLTHQEYLDEVSRNGVHSDLAYALLDLMAYAMDDSLALC